MIALIAAVFIASLLGSMHCVGMCGAFLAFAVAGDPGKAPPSKTLLHAAYNGGRLFTYVTLGAIAGVVGAGLDMGGAAVGVSRAAACIAGGIMIAFGVVAIARKFGAGISKVPVPQWLRDAALNGHRAAAALPPVPRAAAVGLLTTLLPCGWLYMFVATAAGTGNAWQGAITMAVFWLGTLPVMIGLGIGMQSAAGPMRKHLPLITSILMVSVGVWTIFGRMALPAMAHVVNVPDGIDAAVKQTETMEDGKLPCCQNEK